MTTTIFVEQIAGEFRAQVKSADGDIFRLCIDTLKSFIPSTRRSYDPATKHWIINEEAIESFSRWLSYARTNLYAEVQWLDADARDEQQEQKREWTPPSRQLTRADALKTLHLLPDAPASVIRASYKALSLDFHPDRPGGDTRKQQELNAAYQVLMKQMAA